MSNRPYYDVCVSVQRSSKQGDRTFYHRLGRAFVNDGDRRSLTVCLNSAPFSRELVLFPPEDQEAIDWPERFSVSMPVEREDADTYWHNLGVAFYNPPRGNRKRESITVYLDSIPLAGRIGLFEPRAAEDQDDDAGAAAEGESPPF